MSVGRKLRRWREAHGLSERAAARLANVSQPTWRAVERDDTTRIGLDIAARIVRACKGAIKLEDFISPKLRAAG